MYMLGDHPLLCTAGPGPGSSGGNGGGEIPGIVAGVLVIVVLLGGIGAVLAILLIRSLTVSYLYMQLCL